jgi:hypothetical protein
MTVIVNQLKMTILCIHFKIFNVIPIIYKTYNSIGIISASRLNL